MLSYILTRISFLISEPPGRRRPPSPSWPWSIKTSLIVLWGVCWMFFDSISFNDPFFFNDSLGNNDCLASNETPDLFSFDLNPEVDPFDFDISSHGLGAGKHHFILS